MSLRAFCDNCTKEIEDQNKGVVDMRVTSIETPSALGSAPVQPHPVERLIILCKPCRDKFYAWLTKS